MFTLIKPKDPTPVASKHIEYIEPMYEELQAGRAAIKAKEDYVRSARAVGLQLAPVEHMAEQATVDGKVLSAGEKTLERIKRVLAAGAEPTTPNREWLCGALAPPAKVRRQNVFGDNVKMWPDETWPDLRENGMFDHARGRATFRDNALIRVFRGVMPVEAIQRYAAVKDLVDDVRVYSPNRADFEELRNPEPRVDPVLIGRIDFLGEPRYFEIARWDIDKDLEMLHSRLAKA